MFDKIPQPAMSRRRFLAGTIVFLTGQLIPIALIPLVLASCLPADRKALVSVLLVFPIPFIFTLSSIAILGKPSFLYMKNIISGWFKKRRCH
ncbi:MAG: hypothetical protein NC938_06110 [Candidatus Omnitrophica bacterium]|nr:hypothetical protein [Candidatus Omnitrophota bacterium]